MEYDYYLEQKYLYEGRVEARILTAAQAQAMGYEDDYRSSRTGYKLYVDGFNTMKAIHSYLSDLVNCTLVEQENIADESKQLEAIVDFVTFEDETSLIWPWAIPAENLFQNQETLLKIAAAVHRQDLLLSDSRSDIPPLSDHQRAEVSAHHCLHLQHCFTKCCSA